MKQIRGVRIEIKNLKEEVESVKKTVQEPSLPMPKRDIIIAGGEILREDLSSSKNSVELFSWSNKSWSLLNPMMKSCSEASSYFYESQMVVTGGYIFNGGCTDSIESMNIQDKPGHWIDFPVHLLGVI